MYFVFESDIVIWNDQHVTANLLTSIDYAEYTPPDWWDAKPLIKPLPNLHFAINPKLPLIDQYNTGYYELYSHKLVDILRREGVQFELFPALLMSSKNKKVVADNYSICHLLEIYPAIDDLQSDIGNPRLIDEIIERGPDDSEAQMMFNEYMSIRKLIVSQERLAHPKPFFRVAELKDLIFIHEQLKEKLEIAGITGCKYTPVEEYRSLLLE